MVNRGLLKMQLSQGKFDVKQIRQFLVNENKFITDLLTRTCIPDRKDFEDDDERDEKSRVTVNYNLNKTSRAKSLSELQQRLEAIKSKKKLTYKEKLTKKGLKNRMKKKNNQNERNAKEKLKRAAKLTEKAEVKVEEAQPEEDSKKVANKPVFNKEDKIVFSKFDFENVGKHKKTKQEKDPKKLLKKLKERDEEIQKLKESGEVEKAVEIKEKTSWKNALAKAEGQKVKDDPALLAKSVKKQEQKQRSSKKKWEQRIQKVEKAKEERQNKRTENIQKRKKDKKTKKLKNASKRGKIIAGF
ncbi:surfeit locus protein 6 homolog [Leptinotarsa decemlineata]|uniref:surfeit locus protein 6 homolog n=1 Tax=Leptinotarsa decemlineata TaxID=7539 RepID=UPI003D307076